MTGYKGVECQDLEMELSKEYIKEDLDRKIAYYKKICKIEAPYPLNYLDQYPNYEILSIIIGMLIDKRLLR